jgi:hypothetical protein
MMSFIYNAAAGIMQRWLHNHIISVQDLTTVRNVHAREAAAISILEYWFPTSVTMFDRILRG